MEPQEVLIRDPEGGNNQSGLRTQNARLILSYVRRHGALASAEIARRSGLSAQTVSNIVRALEEKGLLQRGEAIKGKVGKPSIPMALNPSGVYSLGLNIGRRSAELVLVDFVGQQVEERSVTYPFPDVEDVFHFLRTGVAEILADHPQAASRLAGIGVGRPNNIWDWLSVVKAPEQALRAWQDISLHDRIKEVTGLDVVEENDATSACVAEHLLGRGAAHSNFVYIFMGSFVGGGLVLNGKVVTGPTNNACAIGPMPIPVAGGGVTQLLNVASLHVLERALEREGIDPSPLRRSRESWADFDQWVHPWIDQTAQYLAVAAVAVASVVEIEAVLIDGAMPKQVRADLTKRTQACLSDLDVTGIARPEVLEGTAGSNARSMGAALLPIHATYFVT